MTKKLIEISLAALLLGCTSGRAINHPEREVLDVNIGHSGYTVSKNNVQYRFRNDSIEGCSLVLGRDAELYDTDCDGTVDEFYDNQGRHLCEGNFNERCDLATRIFQQKKEMLRINEIQELWLAYMSMDVLSNYLD